MRQAALAATLLLALTLPAAATARGPALTRTLRDAKTGFAIHALAGFKLTQRGDVYTIAKGSLKLVYARAKTSQSAAAAPKAAAISTGKIARDCARIALLRGGIAPY